MHIDDIFNAAIQGNKEKLISLLEADEIDINELIDCGVVNGVYTKIPLLYSVLSDMNENGYNYEILDILVNYGIDLDARVEIDSDAFSRRIPMIAYAIRDFKSIELIKYLLSRGAYPDLEQTERYADGHRESYPLIYFAITFWNDSDLLYIMLKHGADPNRRILTYSTEYGCVQVLPPLFYALVNEKSSEKCEKLFYYGASITGNVNTGVGFKSKYNFYDYIATYYQNLLYMLNNAYDASINIKLSPVRVNRKDFLKYKPEKTEENVSNPMEEKDKIVENNSLQEKQVSSEQKELSPKEKLRLAAEKLVEFDKRNANVYQTSKEERFKMPGLVIPGIFMFFAVLAIINTIFFKTVVASNTWGMIISGGIYIALILYRIKKVKDAKSNINLLCNQRTSMLNSLNELDRLASKSNQNRWWNSFNGLEKMNYTIDELMIWMPLKRFHEVGEGLRMSAACTESDTLTGRQINQLIESDAYKSLYHKDIRQDSTYKIAELCMWRVVDGTNVYKYEESYSEHAIQNKMADYGKKLDHREEMKNLFDNGCMFTDRERLVFGQMSTTDFYKSQLMRLELSNKYEEKIRNQTFTRTEVSDQNIFSQCFRPIGIVAFHENGYVAAIILYKDTKETELYDVDFSKVIHTVRRYDTSHDFQEDTINAIRNLKYYNIEDIDILSNKPKEFSDDEWAEFVYARTGIEQVASIQDMVKRKYELAGDKKRKTIAANL